MKKIGLLITVAGFAAAISACGPTKKNPMEAYPTLEGVPVGHPDAADNVQKEYIVIDGDTNVLVTKVNQEDPRATGGIGQNVLQESVFTVTTDKQNINFTSGKPGEFNFTVKLTKGKGKFELDASNVPADAKIDVVKNNGSSVDYKFSWTASAIPEGQSDIESTLKISIKNITEDETAKNEFAALQLKSRDIPFVVRKDDNKPTFEVKGLSGNRKIGEVHKFSVEVTGPTGYTGSPLVPRVFFSPINMVNRDGLVAANGAYFVAIDAEKSAVEKIGDNKWRVNYVFDTKNPQMLPQFDKNLKEVIGISKVLVRVNFRIEPSTEEATVSDTQQLEFFVNL